MNYKLKDFQLKQINQLNSQWDTFCNSGTKKSQIDWDKRVRGKSEAKIIFLVNQPVQQDWKSLTTNKTIVVFANYKVRWVQKILNLFLGLRKWLSKMKYKVRLIQNIPSMKKIKIKESMFESVLGYVDKARQIWEMF